MAEESTTSANTLPKPFGVPERTGLIQIKNSDFQHCLNFVKSRKWFQNDGAVAEDKGNDLLKDAPNYGCLLMGFDFHLTPQGPKLIEVNTNAGGLATVWDLVNSKTERGPLEQLFVKAVKREYELFLSGLSESSNNNSKTLCQMVIVDDNVKTQNLYPEMLEIAKVLEQNGIKCSVVSPEDLELAPDGHLLCNQGKDRVDLIYNRITDFRLHTPQHQHLRTAVIKKTVAISPHPAVYARAADKRLLLKVKDVVVPHAFLLSEKTADELNKIRKGYVFKPPEGNAGKGVYRGDKISGAKLTSLPPDTIVQELVPPSSSPDGTKYDFRIYTRDTDILALVTRHFNGQVMEFRSQGSGFELVIPDDVKTVAEFIQKYT